MSLLPIDPADFPGVPTRKALIALDFQNDFLAEDGALPVIQPDGLIARVISLAEAVRNSGYGEVIWVRSQFDTNRTAGVQQIMASDSPQLPGRSSSSTSSLHRPSEATAAFDTDPEAFLSVTGGQIGKTKPQCVRKGTQGAELFPTIAAAKGPGDYAMTKSYYSAFHSGQLLNLLRRQFATELYICGSLSNVSVYATALAASSHGLSITIVDDCCGYRSEMRHMNTKRKLTEQTGCEYATVAEIIPTLEPKSSSSPSPKERKSPTGPAQIPPDLIAMAMLGSGGKAMPVRPRHTTSSLPHSALSTKDQQDRGQSQTTNQQKSAIDALSHDLSCSLDKLKLSSESTEPSNIPQSASDPPANEPDLLVTQNKVAQSKNKQTVHSLAVGARLETEFANSKEQEIVRTHAEQGLDKPAGVTDGNPPTRDGKTGPARTMVQRGSSKKQSDSKQMVDSSKLAATRSSECPYSESIMMAPTPAKFLDQARAKRSEEDVLPASLLASTKPSSETVERPDSEASSSVDNKIKSDSSNIDSLEALCEGDTSLTRDFLPPTLVEGLFERLCFEVHFKKMIHQGGEVPRFVAVQGQVDADGTEPIYRHPSDESPPLAPFTPAVEEIRTHVARALGHPVNHVLIQCYRNGNDYISEHSDKTLDILKGSYIANVSLGAERVMIFRQKRGYKKEPDGDQTNTTEKATDSKMTGNNSAAASATIAMPEQAPNLSKRQVIRCPMPHNSLIKMGLVTNQKWLHGIRPDKRPQHEKSASELSWNGMRISLTFRCIATFLQPPEPFCIWGQGATSKTADIAKSVINGQTPETISLLKAFGKENNSLEFDWMANYGHGYDVLHMKSAPRYFGCGETIVDGRVGLMLAECGVKYARGNIGVDVKSKKDKRKEVEKTESQPWSCRDPLAQGEKASPVVFVPVPVKYIVDDVDRTTVVGDIAILLYLDNKHPKKRGGGDAEVANIYTRFAAALTLERRWRSCSFTSAENSNFTDEGLQNDDISNNDINSSSKKKALLNSFLSSLTKKDEVLAQFELWATASASEFKTSSSSSTSTSNPQTSSLHSTPFAPIGGGTELSVADYALWPVLLDIAAAWSESIDRGLATPATAAAATTTPKQHQQTVFGHLGLPALERYYLGFAARKSVSEVFTRLGVAVPGILDQDELNKDGQETAMATREEKCKPETT
ncbi:hypothetical protein BD289DRAFT_223514 [Coniella lustricola]|uniref:Fe2OG dioxygenase domain-containing protein n=1 Tax=Coniella lustricola TaxID=2025994 RepID=A0A2T3AAX3_9PEZI|nr:hypothetical protein BD289DRAFT_223514 [Coniella lustricola]